MKNTSYDQNIIYYIVLVGILTIATGIILIEPIPSYAPWRHDGPPIVQIVIWCIIIAVSIGLSFSLIIRVKSIWGRSYIAMLLFVHIAIAIVLIIRYC